MLLLHSCHNVSKEDFNNGVTYLSLMKQNVENLKVGLINMAILSCKDLNVQYDNQVALKDVNFELEDGDYLCIIGDNGSGKSTLMKSILGLVTPKSGNIQYGSHLKSHDIGYLPQQTVVQRDFSFCV